jgi:phage tail-like protein
VPDRNPVAPFTAFNFLVEIQVDGVAQQVCQAEFSECDGLEMSIEPKTIKEGGRNTGPIHMLGQMSYAQLTLKRGMTPTFDLWQWFEAVVAPGGGGLRATAQISILSSEAGTGDVSASFVLTGCLPVKLKSAPLNAKDGQIAIEEMQIAYESMTLQV